LLFGIDFKGFQDENHMSMEQFQNFGMKIMGEPMDFNALLDFRMKMMKSWGESDNNQPMNAANGLAIPNFAIFYGWYRQYRPSKYGVACCCFTNIAGHHVLASSIKRIGLGRTKCLIVIVVAWETT